VLLRLGEFVYIVDYIVLKIEKVTNTASQIPAIVGPLFLPTINALIDCINDMMKLSFGNMNLELNVFNL